ncbi:hypothetical protein M422DRAFT_219400 [Sphaerobolus stellatus SS14]|nr:hypothetical protein M422DRAFT_219400 [Sphaerobolus stellatus SS14]
MSKFFRRHPNPDDLEPDDERDNVIDDDLRLRTVRTAASTIAESIRTEQRAERRRKKSRRGFLRPLVGSLKGKKPIPDNEPVPPLPQPTTTPTVISNKPRRKIYVNKPLSPSDVDSKGDPFVRYVRNKIRTSKYTILTFIPKNLYEQFRRIANLYFLGLVCLQVFPIFGAAAPQLAMVPLVFILTVTAIKDGIEDYRRASLDDQVNNSAATKLGNWRNVNQPMDPRTWFEKLFGLRKPGTISKGVRKLQKREALDAVILQKDGSSPTLSGAASIAGSSLTQLSTLPSLASTAAHTYPPEESKVDLTEVAYRDRSGSLSSSYPNTSGGSAGVVDYNRPPATNGARWERTLWKKLEVGDIVLLRDNDQIPADIVVLSTSDPDGTCYVETKNLDGETNLKPRKSLRATSSVLSEDDLVRSSFYIDSEPPHANLYLFTATLRYTDSSGVEHQEGISINQLLLRGCSLRNTSWVIGMVVFTGPDTKILLNGGDTPSKRSKIERETNFNVVMNFFVLLFMCVVTAVVNGFNDVKTGTSARFFEIDSDPTHIPAVNALVTLASCLIAFQNIVPISLYISIEIVKTIQAYFISQDIDMYYGPFDTACVPKTWNISDDLGQIEYVFSDKTGTLTQNIMEFQKCSVNGVAYGEGFTEAQRGSLRRQGKEEIDPEEQSERLQVLKDKMVQTLTKVFKNRYFREDKLTLISPALAEHLTDRSSPQRPHLISFFRALAICHSVLADSKSSGDPNVLEYKAESPDEAALVAAARDVGFPFITRTNTSIDIEVMGQIEQYTPLNVLEFNSTRKRMSVIVRNPEGKIILYCKGADSVIYSRLSEDQDPELKAATQKNMEDFANGGLRTLCIAYKYLTEDQYMEWSRLSHVAETSTENRDEEIEKANDQIERDLIILGATALEDKLQEGVPEAIETLHKAGIKLWILTGDKLQTAIEIGFSCNLLKNDMEIMILSADSQEAARAQIEAGLNKISSIIGPPPVNKDRNRGFIPGAKKAFAVVIDGDTLRYALESDLKPLFLSLGTQCETVVCCRVSPAQKALTVKLVKEGRNAMTLSIGDGANDVAMIQEANIGCGLFGLEGSQAAMSADYAFGQFRFLTKLLLVHGRWSYLRIADMHSSFFYKNVIWTFAMFWFLFYNSFDATYLYEYTFILLYNLVFTSLPVISLGAFDQDVNAKASMAFPQLYIRGIRGLDYTRWKFWIYMLDGLYQSAVVFFIPYCVWALGDVTVSWDGRAIESLSDFGTTASVAAIFSANIFVGLNTRYWSAITWIIVVGSSLVMIIWIGIYSLFVTATFLDEFVILLSTIEFWGTVMLSVAIALGPRFICKFVTAAWYPTDREIVREMWVLGELKDNLGIPHRRNKHREKIDVEAAPTYEAAPMFEMHYRERNPSENGSMDVSYERQAAILPAAMEDDRFSTDKFSQPDPSKSLSHVDVSNTFVVAEGNEWDMETPIQRPQPPLSSLSYYSASDIPPPSPFPEQNIYTPRSPRSQSGSQSVNMSSVAGAPVAVGYGTTLQPPTTYASRSTPPHTPPTYSSQGQRPASGASAYSGDFEMAVRSPPRTPDVMERSESATSHVTGMSESSFVTAPESGFDHGYDYQSHRQSQDSDAATIRAQPTPNSEPATHDPWRDSRDSAYSQTSQYTISGPHAL